MDSTLVFLYNFTSSKITAASSTIMVSNNNNNMQFFVGLIVMGLLDHFFPEELILRLMNSSSTHVVQNNNNISSINITNKTLGNGDEDDDDLEHGRSESGLSSQSRNIRSLMKTGWVTFIGMALHNAPEGVAVYLSTMRGIIIYISVAVLWSV